MVGKEEDRLLITGLHTVADISCSTCGSVLGWKYVSDSSRLDEVDGGMGSGL